MNRVFGLDLLRAIAVLMVLVAHSRFAWDDRRGLPDFSFFGFLGVELFFVLSGFLIGAILLRSFGARPSFQELRSFWIRRWFRTLPNYYLFLCVNLALWPLVVRGPIHGTGSYWAFLQNFAWPTPLFRGESWYAESWSLAVEEWFYLLFPLVLLGALRTGLPRVQAALLALGLVFAISTGGRIAMVLLRDAPWELVRKGVVFRLDALMTGVLGAWLKLRHGRAWSAMRARAATLGLVLMAVAAVGYALTDVTSVLRRTLLLNITSAAVLSLLPVLDSWRTCSWSGAVWVERISLWSYSLYLSHLPLQLVLVRTLGEPGARVHPALWLTLWAGAAITLSGLLFRYFEHPLTTLRSRFDGAPVRPLTPAA